MNDYIDEPGVSFVPAKVRVTDEMTVPRLIRQLGEETPKKVVLHRKATFGQRWVPMSWRQFIDEIRALARGFIARGLNPGDVVAIMGPTSYEWVLFDYAVQFAGGYAVPIYETSSTDQAEWIIKDSKARFVVVDSQPLRNVVEPVLDNLDFVEEVFVVSDDAAAKISALGTPALDAEIDKRIEAQRANDPWTIIYTSGTTGRPKGAVLTHRNILHVAMNGPLDDMLMEIFNAPDSRTLLFLPLAHSFARFINIAIMYAGAGIAYSPNARNLVADMQSYKPTFILAVPRVFEKIYNAADAKAGRGLKLRTFRTFAKVAINYGRALGTPEGPSAYQRAQWHVGDRLVYSKLKEITGGKLRYAISGGAPLGERLSSFFRGIGMPVLEGYGLTETAAPTAVNRITKWRSGSVGPAYAGTYVKTSDDGEILVKGDHVFSHYHNNPEATKEAFTEDGWFRTGDIGRVDEDDFIWITGRKKELIVTAGGKNVAPAELEDRLRGHPLISQVVVVGDQKPFIAALVTLDEDMLPQWLANKGLEPMTLAEAIKDPQVIAAIDRAIKRANEHVSRAESIRKFEILPADFTVENGYLTPSMKVKRHVVTKDFANVIEQIYASKKSSL